MIRVVVCGVAGRMGQRLAHLIIEDEDAELVGATEYEGHDCVGADVGRAIGSGDLGVTVKSAPAEALAGADVVICFTTPASTLETTAACARAGVPMVVGTTGFT